MRLRPGAVVADTPHTGSSDKSLPEPAPKIYNPAQTDYLTQRGASIAHHVYAGQRPFVGSVGIVVDDMLPIAAHEAAAVGLLSIEELAQPGQMVTLSPSAWPSARPFRRVQSGTMGRHSKPDNPAPPKREEDNGEPQKKPKKPWGDWGTGEEVTGEREPGEGRRPLQW